MSSATHTNKYTEQLILTNVLSNSYKQMSSATHTNKCHTSHSAEYPNRCHKTFCTYWSKEQFAWLQMNIRGREARVSVCPITAILKAVVTVTPFVILLLNIDGVTVSFRSEVATTINSIAFLHT